MRVGGNETQAGAHATMQIARLLLPLREREQRSEVRMRELAAALVEPVAEFSGIVEVKSVQQRSGVEASDTVQCIGIDCRSQIQQIAVCFAGIEQQAVAS